MKLKVYVAGPYSFPCPTENTKTAIHVGEMLHEAGYVPFIPHLTHLWEQFHKHTYDEWLAYDAHWLRVCDAVLRIPGESKGADREVAEAESLRIPVVHSIDELFALSARKPAVTEEAHAIVNGSRRNDYGHPLDDFNRAGRIWAAVLGVEEVTAEQVAMCMVGIKLSRQCNSPKRDNLVDGCGYFETIEMITDERARRS